jgi:hypothetical protein
VKTPEDQMNPKKQKEIRQEDGNSSQGTPSRKQARKGIIIDPVGSRPNINPRT